MDNTGLVKNFPHEKQTERPKMYFPLNYLHSPVVVQKIYFHTCQSFEHLLMQNKN